MVSTCFSISKLIALGQFKYVDFKYTSICVKTILDIPLKCSTQLRSSRPRSTHINQVKYIFNPLHDVVSSMALFRYMYLQQYKHDRNMTIHVHIQCTNTSLGEALSLLLSDHSPQPFMAVKVH